MTSGGRKAILGAVAAVLAAGVLFGRDVIWPTETGVVPSNGSGREAAAPPDVPVVDLELERLQAERGELPDATRNPFRFRPPPAPPPPPAIPRPAVTPDEFAPPAPAGPPPPPPIPVKFFGLMERRGGRVAVFADARGNTFFGGEGDIIEGRYRVVRIGTDSVELAYLDGRGRQTIRLTGQ